MSRTFNWLARLGLFAAGDLDVINNVSMVCRHLLVSHQSWNTPVIPLWFSSILPSSGGVSARAVPISCSFVATCGAT